MSKSEMRCPTGFFEVLILKISFKIIGIYFFSFLKSINEFCFTKNAKTRNAIFLRQSYS